MKTIFHLLALAAAAIAQHEDNGVVAALQSQPDLSQLLAALQTLPGLVTLLSSASNITIFAPTNDAFDNLLAQETAESLALSTGDVNATTNLLTYHVVQGQFPSTAIPTTATYVETLFTDELNVMGSPSQYVPGGQFVGVINNGTGVQVLSGDLAVANVVEADILPGGTVSVHKIDRVLSIPKNITTTLPETPAPYELSTAVAAIAAADLADVLSTASPLTLFVPNNAAFDAIGSVVASADIGTLTQVLQYHAVTGTVAYSDTITNTTVPTVQGAELTLSVIDGTVFVNGAKVILPNILLSNGVAHVIDSVLNPSTPQPFNRASLSPANPPTPAFPSASSAAVSLPVTLPTPTTTLAVPAVLTAEIATATSSGTGMETSPATASGSAPAVASVPAEGAAVGMMSSAYTMAMVVAGVGLGVALLC